MHASLPASTANPEFGSSHAQRNPHLSLRLITGLLHIQQCCTFLLHQLVKRSNKQFVQILALVQFKEVRVAEPLIAGRVFSFPVHNGLSTWLSAPPAGLN